MRFTAPTLGVDDIKLIIMFYYIHTHIHICTAAKFHAILFCPIFAPFAISESISNVQTRRRKGRRILDCFFAPLSLRQTYRQPYRPINMQPTKPRSLAVRSASIWHKTVSPFWWLRENIARRKYDYFHLMPIPASGHLNLVNHPLASYSHSHESNSWLYSMLVAVAETKICYMLKKNNRKRRILFLLRVEATTWATCMSMVIS